MSISLRENRLMFKYRDLDVAKELKFREVGHIYKGRSMLLSVSF